MNKFFLSALALFVVSTSFGQNLSLSNSQLDFDNVDFGDKDSLSLTITNNYSQDVQITGIQFFEKYGNDIYSASEDQFTITAGQDKVIWIYFEPEHNILYNSEMIIESEYRGSFAVDLIGNGKFDSYYSSTFDKSEEDLKTAFKTLLAQGYVSLGYSGGRDKMFMEFDNQKVNGQGASVNTIEGVYTGQLVTNYNSRTDAQNQGFNTEHTFPQGFFSSNEPMRSDLHHLFPTNSTANTQRGNLPFGVVTGSSTWSVGGSKKDNSVFEPRDIHKGAVARAMMYFVLRYEDYSNFLSQQESILRQWHYDDLPDQIDINRNNEIALLQKNRNPFVDYPQFLERIQSISGNSVQQTQIGLYVSNFSLDMTIGDYVSDDEAQIVLTNYGNEDVTLEEFELTGNIEFTSAQPDITLLPGESHVLEMVLVPGNGGQGELGFETNATGSGIVSIPITLPSIVPDGVEEIDSNWSLYPNPANDKVQIAIENEGTIKIYDAKGGLQFEKTINQNLEFSIEDWKQGVYFVSIETKNTVQVTTLIVK